MQRQRNKEAESLLCAAIDFEDADDRRRFLDSECGDNAELREQVEQLVGAHFNAGDFLQHHSAEETLAFDDLKQIGSRVGQYKLLEQIGEGGMGVVYVAVQQNPIRRTVALKLIKPGMDSRQVIARFNAERQALAMMNHPHIAKVLDAGATESGRPYFVMELVKGIPITDFCDQHQLDLPQRLELFRKVCEAVQHAHQKGIIHRDLKPTNILVELEDVRAAPKVIDFGVAKAMHQALTENSLQTGFHQIIGTPMYMSPEQAQLNSLDVDTRSDIYSLGVLLYELLTGATPFSQKSLQQAGFDEMRRIIREDEPPRPSARVSTLEQKVGSTVTERRKTDVRQLTLSLRCELDWIVMKALEKDRARRYDSASALAADLQRYLDDQPVSACPPSKFYILKKALRRNKSLLATTAFVLIVLLSGALLATWQAVRATSAESRAARSLKETDRQRSLAEKNLAVALDAVDRMLTGVAESSLAAATDFVDLRERLLQDASQLHDQLIELDPNNSDLFIRRGLIYHSLQQSEEALADFSRALTIDPDNPNAHARLASFLRVCHKESLLDLEAAQDHAEEAVRLAPLNPWYWEILGTIYRGRGMDSNVDQQKMFSQSMSAYEKAIGLSEGYGSAETGQEQGTRTADAIRLAPQGSVLAACYLGRAEVFLVLNKFELAIFNANIAIKVDKRFADAYRIIAESYQRQGEMEQSKHFFSKSLEIDPYNFNSLQGRSDVFREFDLYDTALQDLSMSIRLAPQKSYLYKRRASIYFQLGEFSRAQEDLTSAVDLNPTDVSNLFWTSPYLVAKCPNELYQRRLMELADRTVQLTQSSPSALAVRGHLLAILDERDKGRTDIQTVVSSEFASCYSLFLSALFYVSIGDYEAYQKTCSATLAKYSTTRESIEASLAAWTIAIAPEAVEDYAAAIALARLAVELEPNNRSARRTLGALLMRSGRYEPALEQLHAALEMPLSHSPSAPVAHAIAYEPYLLALTYFQLGQETAAIQWLDRAEHQAENDKWWYDKMISRILYEETKRLTSSMVVRDSD